MRSQLYVFYPLSDLNISNVSEKISKNLINSIFNQAILSDFIQMRSLLIPECQRQKESRNATKMEQKSC